MLPPDTFSMSAAQAWVAGTSGCAGGTHSDTFMVTVLSCASAGVTQAATSSAKKAFLIDVSPSCHQGFSRLPTEAGPVRSAAEPYNNLGGKYCGQKLLLPAAAAGPVRSAIGA